MKDLQELLSNLNRVACTLEKKGFIRESSALHEEFMKLAQIPSYNGGFLDPEIQNNTGVDPRRVNGPRQMEAIKKLQSKLKINQDGLFGPATVEAIVKVLDSILPESFLKEDYKKRVDEYKNSLDPNFVNQLAQFAQNKKQLRALYNAPATKPSSQEPSDLKIKILNKTTGY